MARKTFNDKGEKRCTKCLHYKHLDYFHRSASGAAGRYAICIDCRKLQVAIKCGLLNTTEEVARRQIRLDAILKSKQSANPPEEKKFMQSKLMNPWTYPDKGAFDVWMENKK